MPSITIKDLLAFTAFSAVYLALARVVVRHAGYDFALLLIGLPIMLTAALQWRFKLAWHQATALHYPIAVVWAFVAGVVHSLLWRQLPHSFYDRGSVGLDDPFRFGLFAVEIMLVVALASTVGYGLVSWYFSRNR